MKLFAFPRLSAANSWPLTSTRRVSAGPALTFTLGSGNSLADSTHKPIATRTNAVSDKWRTVRVTQPSLGCRGTSMARLLSVSAVLTRGTIGSSARRCGSRLLSLRRALCRLAAPFAFGRKASHTGAEKMDLQIETEGRASTCSSSKLNGELFEQIEGYRADMLAAAADLQRRSAHTVEFGGLLTGDVIAQGTSVVGVDQHRPKPESSVPAAFSHLP